MTGPYRAFCEKRKKENRFRQLQETQPLAKGRAMRNGEALINFTSNDYLGLSRHPLLIERAKEFADLYGAGSTASRLVSGNLPAYIAIEERLAHGKGSETALVFASGYQANISILAALADAEALGKPVAVFADRLCHNSLLQGLTLSGARFTRFRHNDYDHLAALLDAHKDKNTQRIIVSESVFSMDGDCADMGALVELAGAHGALLYVDEAHATGVFGPDGFGLCAEYKGTVDVAMGTFGKALGGFGAYVACSHVLRDYLIQRCGGFIYSTALPPPVLGTMDAALELLPRLQGERAHLLNQAARLRSALQTQGWNCGASTTQIIPVILGDEGVALTLAENLRAAGILAAAIRPPTVPSGTSRLRFSLSAAHTSGDIDRLIQVMAEQARTFAARQSLAS